ncbi:MAG: hypothetical protein IJ757_04520 [Clostridiales bacterium]|nr:hypothetical protein [Clostridiales bacterium]
MSMIDTSDKNIKNAPFSDLTERKDGGQSPFDSLSHVKGKGGTYLSTRAAVFTAFVVVAVCLMLPGGGAQTSLIDRGLIISLALAVASVVVYIGFWTLTLRHLESPDVMPLSIALNLVPAVVIRLLIHKLLPAYDISLMGLVFLASGATCLSLISSDETQKGKSGGSTGKTKKDSFTGIDFLDGEVIRSNDFTKADVRGEIVMPCVYATVASVLGCVMTVLIRTVGAESVTRWVGVRLLISSLMLMLISLIVSKVSGKDHILSSRKLNDAANLPMTDRHNLRSFFLRRLRFMISLVLISGECLLVDYLNVRFGLGLYYMKYVFSALLVFAFAFIRGRHSKRRIQFATELGVVYVLGVSVASIWDAVPVLLFATLIDTLITGLIFAHNRRLLMSRRSRYVEGMPLELMSVSLVVMISEIMLAYWYLVL